MAMTRLGAAVARGQPMTPPMISSSDDEGEARQDDSDMEEVTTEDIIVRVTNAWQAEKLAPELLPPVEGEVKAVLDELVIMEDNLRKLQPTDLRLSIHRMEVKRLRYIITSYLRLRLLKIQEYAWYYADVLPKQRSTELVMTKNEMIFMRDYLSNLEGFLKEVALDHMPETFKAFSLESRPQLRKPPNLSRFVFFRSNITTNITFYDENHQEETIELEQGGQYIMPYGPLRQHVERGEIVLI